MASLPPNVYKYKSGQIHDGDAAWYGYKTDKLLAKIHAGNWYAEQTGRSTDFLVGAHLSVGPDEINNCGEYYMFGEVIFEQR